MRKKTQELQYLETMKKRLGLTQRERRQLEKLEKGYEGEVKLDQIQTELTGSLLPTMDDVWLKTDRTCVQIDKLLVVDSIVYVVDAKNYSGVYHFSTNETLRNGVPLQENILEQLHNAMRAVKRTFLKEGVTLEVCGVLIFMNDMATIQVADDVADLILTTATLELWLQHLAEKVRGADRYLGKKALENNLSSAFKCKWTLAENRQKFIRPGLQCCKCGCQNLIETSYTMHCPRCNYDEPKETAYVRTICDFGVLFHKEDLKVKPLLKFMGRSVNEVYLRKMLKKHFKIKIKMGRNACYYNKGETFEYWFEEKKDYFESIEHRINWISRK